ncbi:hypothetical protein Ddye_007934 [Dipteronia dyeriana]|uniref:Reverse transcriptase zinc-binding domain-containing protein n=1 Tax=Dipteronia dyeriana TaxID=168575 RepID=A0AAD9XLE5_9ROSI|nr:hypothetical protein Ddye_007934 [Dipteronia dyeriana]
MPEDTTKILATPVSRNELPDVLMWHYDKLGNYSVRSGYWLGINLDVNSSSSSLASIEARWKFLWRIEIPLKNKLFIWKACHNFLPTMVNLASHKVSVNSMSQICQHAPELTMHALWGCHFLKDITRCCSILQVANLASP